MDSIPSYIIGDIQITIYQTSEGYYFFQIKANNENVLPVLDVIEDVLLKNTSKNKTISKITLSIRFRY